MKHERTGLEEQPLLPPGIPQGCRSLDGFAPQTGFERRMAYEVSGD